MPRPEGGNKQAGCVQARRDGKRMLYRLGPGPLASVVAALHDYVKFQHMRIREAIAESRQRPQEMESVSIDGLLDRLDEGVVMLPDIRDDDEFAQGHLPGAINIPFEQLVDRIWELSRDVEVVAYCRGSYCVLSMQAAPLAGGASEWRCGWLRTGRQCRTVILTLDETSSINFDVSHCPCWLLAATGVFAERASASAAIASTNGKNDTHNTMFQS